MKAHLAKCMTLARLTFSGHPNGGHLAVERDGRRLLTIGRPDQTPRFVVETNRPGVVRRILKDPDFNIGETYVDGDWRMAEGDLGALLTWLAGIKGHDDNPARHQRRRRNDPVASRSHAEHHYGIGNDLYELVLDEGLNYSCAFFDSPGMSLRDAQLRKIDTTLDRLDLQPGMAVLDIGCGWGETTRRAVVRYPDVQATGITLAEPQAEVARERAAGAGAHNRLRYLIQDYRYHARETPAAYDRIVSIGMYEHVGHAHAREYFQAVARLLKPGGKALIHFIARPEPGHGTSRWLDTHIFPGGSIPYPPDAEAAAQAVGLHVPSAPFVHHGSNYAETVRRWRANFLANLHRLDPRRYDARFRRLWEFYLACSEAAFDGQGLFVVQLPLRRPVT